MRESRFERWYGRDEPPVETRQLVAGPLTAELEGIDLRYIRWGGAEIVRRLFVAVRDAAWGTIPPRIDDLSVETGAQFFRVSFEARHDDGGLCFRWHGELAGHGDGRLECRLDGLAESDFQYNRIGFCVLHPRENAGRPYRARTPSGESEGTLPDVIGQQRFAEGTLWPLFPSYTLLEIEVDDSVRARFEFSGDLFEMEDQRNWTDASFKTYSTPITLGWPHEAKAGQRIEQVVRLACSGRAASTHGASAGRIQLGEPTGVGLPALGLGTASHGEPLSEREVSLIGALGPDQLRVDLVLDSDWHESLGLAAETADSVGAGLELALFVGTGAEAELDRLVAAPELRQARIDRVLVFGRDEAVSGSAHVARARERLGVATGEAVFAAGTDQWFTDLNRERPKLDGVDAVVYSVCATVHADDNTSVRETPATQADTVRSAAALFGLPVIVSPVTIRPRRWPFGELEGYAGLPYQVDPRQCACFGAAWTAASVKHLSEAGAAAVTYFETTGWRGVIERELGSQAPEAFPSSPGAVFPLYHVLADAAEWRRGEATLLPAHSSEPLAVEALAARTAERLHLLIACLEPRAQRVVVDPLPEGTASVRTLDEESFTLAAEDPEAFRAGGERIEIRGGRLELELLPYSVVRVDL